MRNRTRILVLLVAVVCTFALFTSNAYAYTGYWVRCENCHSSASGATVTATPVSNDGTNATYTIATTNGTEWALFAGYSRLAAGTGAGGTVTVPAGVTYDIYTVAGSPSAGKYAKTTISPASSWVMPGTDDLTPPVSATNAVANYANRATIEITASDPAGVEGPAWGVGFIYYQVDGGTTRSTPTGMGGKAIVVVAPNTAGVSSHTLEFWSTDRYGNDENSQNVSFTITRAAASSSGGVGPSVIGANGASAFSYMDLRDATEKNQGGYVAFGGVSGRYSNPHGGYSASSNKCKVCHAVHRAEGAYYLLRADSQADACNYCHIGGSAHSSLVVYDLNPAGTDTTNGHTMGAGMVPDSSVSQTAQAVTITGTDVNGATVSEDINVRSYDPALISMYRFSRHHSQAAVTTGRSGFKPVGPNSLSCFSCHQPHGAPAQEWQPTKFTAGFVDDGNVSSTYKLLRRYPSGSWKKLNDASHGTGLVPAQAPGLNQYGMVDVQLAVKVPETTLTAGFNYSQTGSNAGSYLERGITSAQPTWIAQNISGEAAGSGLAEDPATVNTYALSVWCADCHNLNIGGSEELTNEELGFKAHSERTHPAPFTGAHSGPGQCYSCHRNDLSVSAGVSDPAGYGMDQVAPMGGTTDACSQCHYGTLAYSQDQAATSGRESDFPHSGKASDIKLLGSYTANVAGPGSYVPVFSQATIAESNLDAVCIRCHPGIGVHN